MAKYFILKSLIYYNAYTCYLIAQNIVQFEYSKLLIYE